MTGETPRRTRNANGEGSVYQDDTGRWHAWVTVGMKPNGRPDRRHREGKTRKEVVAKVRELEKARDAGKAGSAGRPISVEEWLTRWIRDVAPNRLRRKALASYATDVYKHLIPGLGAIRLQRLTWVQIEEFERRMRQETKIVDGATVPRYRPATVDHVHRTLRSALKDAVQADLITFNPAANVVRAVDQSVEAADFEGEVLTVDEARRVIEAALRRRGGVRHVVRLALGLRQAETLGLPWARTKLDSAAPQIRIIQQLQRHTWRHGCGPEPMRGEPWKCGAKRGADCPTRHSGGLVLTQVKTKSGERPIPLDPVTVCHLLRHRAEQAGERLAAGNRWRNAYDLVFTQEDGAPIDPRADLREWKEILVEAGVREVRLHDARHSAATVLLVQGVDKRVVMDLMGWSSEAMLRRYQHVVDELRREAISKATAYLYGPSDGVR